MNDWRKMLSDLAVTTEKPLNEGLIVFAMYLDLYSCTKSHELKEELEKFFIKTIKGE